jgi:ribosomal-protein-alanine N-acetyltransferase
LPDLESARLRLRPFRREQVADLHRLWTDPDVRRYLWDDRVISMAEAAEVVEAMLELDATHGLGMWALFRKEDGPTADLIGFCGFRFVGDSTVVELLYGLLPSCWGQGLATEAARAALAYAFETRGLDRVVASADAPNAPSLRVMQRLGMRPVAPDPAFPPAAVYYELRRQTP